jgi:hypothetical protein
MRYFTVIMLLHLCLLLLSVIAGALYLEKVRTG